MRKKSPTKMMSKALANITRADLAYELELDLKKGMSSKELREKYQARLTAKNILTALTSEGAYSITAVKDLTDRNEGRPSEKTTNRSHLEKLTDEQLNAMLLTEIDDLEKESKLH